MEPFPSTFDCRRLGRHMSVLCTFNWSHVFTVHSASICIVHTEVSASKNHQAVVTYDNKNKADCFYIIAKKTLKFHNWYPIKPKVIEKLLIKTTSIPTTVWKVSKYGVISGPYFPVFGLNTEIYSLRKSLYSVRIQENMDQK